MTYNKDWWKNDWSKLFEKWLGLSIFATFIVIVFWYISFVIFVFFLVFYIVTLIFAILVGIGCYESCKIKKLQNEIDKIDRVIELKEKGIIP